MMRARLGPTMLAAAAACPLRRDATLAFRPTRTLQQHTAAMADTRIVRQRLRQLLSTADMEVETQRRCCGRSAARQAAALAAAHALLRTADAARARRPRRRPAA